jgi:hypothetical protein
LPALSPLTPAYAQNQAVDDLKGKIFDARMAKQTFAAGLKFCSELEQLDELEKKSPPPDKKN